MIEDFSGKRVTVLGLGRFGGGVGATRWLAEQGARVRVSDSAEARELQSSLELVADLDVEFSLGGHQPSDFSEADCIVVSPALSDTAEPLRAAQDADVPITTEINLFIERCPARCVGITGSVGKSTTTAMLGHILERAYTDGQTWVGGNVGRSLLPDLPKIQDADIVVLELSSFQLHRTPAIRWSPHVAMLTSLAPNHLDWHETFAAYAADKLNIVRFQDPERDHIVIQDCGALREPFSLMFGDLAGIWRYALDDDETPAAKCQSTSAIESDDQFVRWAGLELAIPGRHNRENAAGALTAAHVLGVDSERAVPALRDFAGLPDRLERVAERGGVAYYNDSKSTTPEAAVIAIQAIERPLLIVLGGYDKGIDLGSAARLAAQRARFAACVGQTGPTIHAAVQAAGGASECFAGFDEAVRACVERATPGDAVLLSPGCASWDQFPDFRARGAAFRRIVCATEEGA